MDRLARRLEFARLALVAGAVIVFTAPRINGQSQQDAPKPLTFEVASIRPLAPPYPSGGGPWTVSHGQFRAQTGWVRGVIAWAHDVLAVQVRGGPSWIDSDLYDFAANAADKDAGPEQIKAMIRALLADRFKLVVHHETQELQAYTLVIGKNGSKMEESTEGKKNYINWTGSGQVEFTECSLLCLINVLSTTLGSPVIDQTGLKGQYTFKLEFTDPRAPTPRNDGPPQADARPSLFAAVQDQLGLKLEAKSPRGCPGD